MATNKSYAIFWAPSGYTFGSGYTSTITQFFGDVAHDNGMSSNVYAVTTQYSGIQYNSRFRRLLDRCERVPGQRMLALRR